MADNLKDFIEPIAIKGPNEMKKGLERAYFPELDSLRFFAFLMVFGFHHGLPNLGSWIRDILAMTIDLPILILFGTGGIGNRLGPAVDHALSRNGWIGVNLFFTLSGFIITRLLLREELQYGRIDWSAFWVRRILRIWPLYYLIFLIGFLGLPFTDRIHGIGLGSPQMPWFGLFLGNWSMIHFGPIGSDILSILWSVCVEEQFYIFIPIVIAILGTRGRWIFSITGILIAILQRISLAKSGVQQYQITYNSVAQMDSILAGVLLALALNHEPFRNTIVHLTRKYLVWLILPVTLFLITRNHLGHEIVLRQVVDPVAIWLVALVWIMVAAAGSPRFSRILSWPAFVGAGKISYGLYMWHEILLSLFGSGFMTLAAVILTAWLSYEFLEKAVLR